MNKYIIISSSIVLFLSSCGKKMEETKPIRKDITETVFASGILEAENTYNLTAQSEGYITALYFKEGDIVGKEKLLAIVENKDDAINIHKAADLLDIALKNTQANAPLLLQAEKDIVLAKQKMLQDKDLAERYERLWKSNSIAKIDFDDKWLNYQTSKINYENALENHKNIKDNADEKVISNQAQKDLSVIAASRNQVKAMEHGKIYEQLKHIGDYVRKGDAIATIGSDQFIYAKLNVDEGSIGKIKAGQQATIQLNTIKDKVYKGTVYEISPSFDNASQSFIVKLKFIDPLDFTITKTQLQANILIETRKNVMLIPRKYLDLSGTVQIKGKKEPAKIQTRVYSNQYIEVVAGISDNDVLVAEDTKESNNNSDTEGSSIK